MRFKEENPYLISVLHKVDAFVHIAKQDEGLHNIKAADEHGSIKEGCSQQTATSPLVHLQLVTYRQDQVTFQARQIGHWPSVLPAEKRKASVKLVAYSQNQISRQH